MKTTPTVVVFGEEVLDRMVRAAQRVQERMSRSTSALKDAAIPCAFGGSNASAVWIASVDVAAVRQSRNVELVLCRRDLPRASQAFHATGFFASQSGNQIRFLDGPDGRWRDGIEITFAGEHVEGKTRLCRAPLPDDSEDVNGNRVLRLPSLVEFQLARFRLDDAVDLRDLIDVGLIDESWVGRFPPELAARLQELLDNPDG